jgi:hypothetical protein
MANILPSLTYLCKEDDLIDLELNNLEEVENVKIKIKIILLKQKYNF